MGRVCGVTSHPEYKGMSCCVGGNVLLHFGPKPLSLTYLSGLYSGRTSQ